MPACRNHSHRRSVLPTDTFFPQFSRVSANERVDFYLAANESIATFTFMTFFISRYIGCQLEKWCEMLWINAGQNLHPHRPIKKKRVTHFTWWEKSCIVCALIWSIHHLLSGRFVGVVLFDGRIMWICFLLTCMSNTLAPSRDASRKSRKRLLQ